MVMLNLAFFKVTTIRVSRVIHIPLYLIISNGVEVSQLINDAFIVIKKGGKKKRLKTSTLHIA